MGDPLRDPLLGSPRPLLTPAGVPDVAAGGFEQRLLQWYQRADAERDKQRAADAAARQQEELEEHRRFIQGTHAAREGAREQIRSARAAKLSRLREETELYRTHRDIRLGRHEEERRLVAERIQLTSRHGREKAERRKASTTSNWWLMVKQCSLEKACRQADISSWDAKHQAEKEEKLRARLEASHLRTYRLTCRTALHQAQKRELDIQHQELIRSQLHTQQGANVAHLERLKRRIQTQKALDQAMRARTADLIHLHPSQAVEPGSHAVGAAAAREAAPEAVEGYEAALMALRDLAEGVRQQSQKLRGHTKGRESTDNMDLELVSDPGEDEDGRSGSASDESSPEHHRAGLEALFSLEPRVRQAFKNAREGHGA